MYDLHYISFASSQPFAVESKSEKLFIYFDIRFYSGEVAGEATLGLEISYNFQRSNCLLAPHRDGTNRRPEIQSHHLVFDQPLGHFPVGVASRTCPAYFPGTFWSRGRTVEISPFGEVARRSGLYEFHSCALCRV